MTPQSRIRRLEKERAALKAERDALRDALAVKANLWPGDTPVICAMRLEAAADEASALWADSRSRRAVA